MSELVHQNTISEREGGVVKKGHDEGMKMAVSVLEEFGLPLGLLPLADVTEVGFVRSTGYFWIHQQSRVEHYFKMVSKQVSYETDLTGYVQQRSIKKLKGVSAKMLLWLSINEITIDESSPGKVNFRGLGGVSKTFPVEAFAAGQ